MSDTATSAQEVLTERVDNILVITINRPEQKNAINGNVARALTEAIEQLENDPTLTVGVLTGAGGVFSAGMDLKAFLAGEKITDPERGLGFTKQLPAKPMIAAVDGYALAGGFELALACDIIIASETAKFGLPEVKRGLIAAAGGLFRLPQRIPKSKAVEYLLTGDMILAEDAHRYGLVNTLTGNAPALDTAMELARRISANGPLAVQTTKRIIDESADWAQDEMFANQQPYMDQVFQSADAKEGALAFKEKRSPNWTGQ